MQRRETMKFTRLAGCIPLLFTSFCATQDDADVLFSDTEKESIKTLIYQDPAADPTNAYVQNSSAATLGQKFFWDAQFSGGIVITGNRVASTYSVGTAKLINCAACHDPDFGWADKASKPNDVSLGANFTSRNAPTVLNSAHNTYSLWDGSTDSVWAVARPATEGAPHNFSRVGVAFIVCQNATYKAAYEAIFGTTNTTAICGTIDTNYCGGASCVPATGNNWGRSLYTGSVVTDGHVDRIFANFGKAIAAYERLIVSKNSAFDQWANGNENAMTARQKRGLKIFITKGNCIRCHSGPNFSDGSFHNLGVPQVGGFSGTNDQGRYDGITTLTTGSNSIYNSAGAYNDNTTTNRVSGLSAASTDIGKFKTPTLRSVNKTPPYFHNGTFNSLWDVVNFYNFAGNAGNFPGTKDTILTTRHMTTEEMEDLVTFLGALEGEALSTSLTTSPGGFGTTTGW
jgi:cytochrome c peroxidase